MKQGRTTVVVLVSGGMDSCVAAAEARAAGHELAFLHGNYGQRTEARELTCFHAIADRMEVPHSRRLVADMRYLAKIGGSSLTDPGIPVEVSSLASGARPSPASRRDRAPGGTPGGPGDERPRRHSAAGASDRSIGGAGRTSIPSSYVPFRNAHFLAIAVSWAETLGASAIYIGAVEEDSSGYPDCREEYYGAFQKLIALGTRPETRLSIVTPLIHLDKAAIVRRGLELGAPFDLTWSCYSESELACGECDSCALRKRGFERAGATDPVPYRRRER